VFERLGWNWEIGMAALASFPAREVVVGTLGMIYGRGEDAEEDDVSGVLSVRWADAPGGTAANVPRALSLMVFFALCAQCVSTLVVMRRETNSWAWPAFAFVYMTALAYLAAWLTFQIGWWLVG
jgi:ferrous iron transport protein B